LSIHLDLLKTLINNQKEAIRYQFLFALIILCLGIFIIIFSNFFITAKVSNDSIKLIFKIGGGFISTVSAYPVNQIITRKEKIKTYEVLLTKVHEMTKPELKRMEEIVWKSIEKVA